MIVKIIKCDKPTFWYYNEINCLFRVKEQNGMFMIDPDFYGPQYELKYIAKEDAEIIKS